MKDTHTSFADNSPERGEEPSLNSVVPSASKMAEPELTAAIQEAEKLWTEHTLYYEAEGGSPYSPMSVLLSKGKGSLKRGERILLVPLGKSHNGHGNYKNRGRWRTVWLARRLLEQGEERAGVVVCHATDKGATQIGCLPLYVTTEEAWQQASSVGTTALKGAFAALGL